MVSLKLSAVFSSMSAPIAPRYPLFISATMSMTSSSPFLGNRKIGRSTCIQLRQVGSRNISQTFNIVIQPKRVYGIQGSHPIIFKVK